MSQMKTKYPSNLLKYFVFNTSWGQKEGQEHEKLIYYWCNKGGSDGVAMEQQISDCGLAEGVINFVSNFGNQNQDQEDIKCQAIHGMRTRIVLDELENDYWSVMVISVSYSILKGTQDDEQIVEYHQEEINDRFVRLMMRNIYRHFKFLNGQIDMLWKECNKDRNKFLELCKHFFDSNIPHLKLTPIHLIQAYSAIQYLPLDNINFMLTQSFVNHVVCLDCNRIVNSMFLYNDQLVCSSLTLNDTKTVYSYLTTTIIPDVICEEISGLQQNVKTRWIKKGLKVYLTETNQFYEMNLFRSINGATVVLFLTIPKQQNHKVNQNSNKNDKEIKQETNELRNQETNELSNQKSNELKNQKTNELSNQQSNELKNQQSNDKNNSESNEDILSKCEALMCSRLVGLTTKLAEIAIKINGSQNLNCESVPSESFKFVYFNASNRAYKSNISSMFDLRKLSDAEFVRFVIDIESDLSTTITEKNIREIISKTTNDSWLIVHHSDSRTLFSMLNHKNANLIEASETVNALTSKQFKNILFID